LLKARQEQLLETVWIRSVNGVRNLLTAQTHKLEIVDKTLSAADPAVILKRGYSLTRAGGRVVKCASDLKRGDRLTTVFADGSVESEIV
jgi:exodeoxyribonuclease VII large subunit